MTTESEKAKQLFDKFQVMDFHPDNPAGGYVLNIKETKEMACKCVDEIIDNMPLITEIYDYWERVKFEINELYN